MSTFLVAVRIRLLVKDSSIRDVPCWVGPPDTIQIEGQTIGHWFLTVDSQPEVGADAYDRGAEILTKFLHEQVSKFREDDLDPIGRRIFDACLDGATFADYDALSNL